MIKNRYINFLQQHLWWMLLLFIIVLQIPFLNADPDLYLSHSRDAHSDEGLNTIQLRNYINHGYLDPWECDNLMKNPLFNLILFLPFKLFGTKLLVARLTVLGFIAGVLFFIGLHRSWQKWLVFLVPVVFLQFHIFQYMHFSLAEMMSVGCILLSMFGWVQMWDEKDLKKKIGYLLMALSFLCFSWYMKIQFLYTIGIGAFLMLIYLIWDFIKYRSIRNVIYLGFMAAIYTAVLGFLYYQFWYLPYQLPFEYIMKNQAGNRFGFGIYFWQIVAENFNRYFTAVYVQPLWITFVFSLPLGIYLWIKGTHRMFNRIFLFSLLWFIVELHKITIHHVPSRYLLSAYVAMLLLSSTVFYGIYQFYREHKGTRLKYLFKISFLGLILLISSHLTNYTQAFKRRTFQVKNLNNYLYHYNTKNFVAIGPWAPTVTWNTKIRSFPVWKDFLNYQDIKVKYHPDIVVTEPGEADSDGAFCADNFDIVNESDSVKMTWIGKWPVHIYWMKK